MPSTPEQDFLMGGGGPKSAFTKYDAPGTVRGGEILEYRYTQQTDMKTREKKFWKDGNPMMQLEVTVSTDQRDPQVQDDDGRRRLFVKGEMTKAVRAAVEAATATMIAKGGTLLVQYTGDAPPAAVGLDGAKLYAAHYTAPPIGFGTVDSAAGGLVMSAPVATPQPTQPIQPTAPQAAPLAFPQPTGPGTLPAPHADEAAAVAALQAGGLLGAPQAPAATVAPAVASPAAPVAPSLPAGLAPDVAAALAALSPEERAQMGLPPA